MACCLQGTGSCAMAFLSSLSSHTSPQDAVRHLIKSNFLTLVPKEAIQHPYAHITFIQGSTYSGPRYGELFAQYLVEHNLGEVYTPGVRNNTKFYGENHPCQMWVWTPSKEGLEKWWNEVGKELQAKVGK